MRILFLNSEGVSNNLAFWLQNDEQEEVIIHSERIDKSFVENIQPHFIISYNYHYLIHEEILNMFVNRAINLHISILPWNKGADPNFWSFVEDSPKGVTIHYLDKGMDTGEILLQHEVKFIESEETLSSSYDKLHLEIQNLFMLNWKRIKQNSILSIPQNGEGSVHFRKDFNSVKHILGEKLWQIKIPELKQRYNRIINGNHHTE